MFPPSALTLTFKPSRDYQRLIGVLSAAAGVLLWQAHWPGWITLPVTIGLLWWAYTLIQQGKPHPEYDQLIYLDQRWRLYDAHGVVTVFTAARIRYDVGLFMRVELMSPLTRRWIVLFQDQLPRDKRRAFYLLQLEQTGC